jgi:hypothetical protein
MAICVAVTALSVRMRTGRCAGPSRHALRAGGCDGPRGAGLVQVVVRFSHILAAG